MTTSPAPDAVETARLVGSKQVSPREVVSCAIERIESTRQLNAVVIPMYEAALERAMSDPIDRSMSGVPILLKDLFASCRGVPETEGSSYLKGWVADHDSELVKRLTNAGAIIVGKTNTPEFGNMSTTEPHLYGATHNPWNAGVVPGGSSGGSAAAVAARLVPIAHGNDGGGSIRIPASCCGVFGLKPTRGRTSFAPDYGDVFGGLVAQHALTTSVRDSALFLDVVGGPADGDMLWPPVGEHSFLDEVGRDPGALRIGFAMTSHAARPVHADCREAVEGAASLCAELGHEVIEASPTFDWEAAESSFFSLWADSNAWLVDLWSRRIGRSPDEQDLEPLTWALVSEGRRRTAADHMLAMTDLQVQARRIAEFFVDYDLWLTPTLAEPPVPLGTFDPPPHAPLSSLERDGEFSPFTWVANVTGQPAMSVPTAWNSDGLPIGVHFVGRVGREDMLLRLAAQIENARPWSSKVPPTILKGGS